MKRHPMRRLFRLRKKAAVLILPETSNSRDSSSLPFKAIGLASIAVGVAALGVYVGRELRSRYKFKRRTPYDRYSHAGDEGLAEFGVGI